MKVPNKINKIWIIIIAKYFWIKCLLIIQNLQYNNVEEHAFNNNGNNQWSISPYHYSQELYS